MDKTKAQTMARELLDYWQCEDVKFKWTRGHQTLGWAKVNKRTGERTMGLSLPYVLHNSVELVKDTILHEIAHFLAGPNNGHNWHWRQWCVRVGADPTRTKSGVVSAPLPWGIHCGHCEEIIATRSTQRMKLTNKIHPPCGVLSKGKLTWVALDTKGDPLKST